MNPHDFCRVLLKVARDEFRQVEPRRFLKAEVTGRVKIASHTHFSVRVVDHVDPASGTKFPSEGCPGHFRNMTYEVVACCAYSAKVDALNKHTERFP